MLDNMVTASTEPYDINEKITTTLNKALDWISDSQNENGSWGDQKIINDTCYGIYSLKTNNREFKSGIKYVNNFDVIDNTDTLSHCLIATGDKDLYSENLVSYINDDGGVGLNKTFSSEIYDTVLAFEALESLHSEEYNSVLTDMINYIINNQKDDGSWRCNEYNDSGQEITARTAYIMSKYINENQITSSVISTSIAKANAYLSSVNLTDFSELSIRKSIYTNLFRNSLGDYTSVYETVEAIEEAQNSDGSFYGDMYNTYLVIKYLNSLDTLDSSYTIDSLKVELDNDSVYVNTETVVNATYSVNYKTALDKCFNMTTKIYKDDIELYSEETALSLSRDKTDIEGCAFSYNVNVKSESVLKVISVLYDDDKEIGSFTNFIYVQQKPIQPKTQVTDAGITLNEYYGYVGQEGTVVSSYYLLYSTNVSYTITVKTTVYCGDEVIESDEQQAVLTPDLTNISAETAKLNLSNNVEDEYTFVTHFYDGEKLLDTVKAVYTICQNPNSEISDSDGNDGDEDGNEDGNEYDDEYGNEDGDEDGDEDGNEGDDENGKDDEQKINTISNFNVTLDKYCTYAGKINEDVTASCEILYSFYEDLEITVKGFVLDGDKIISSKEQKIFLSKDSSLNKFEIISATLDTSKEKKYLFKAEVYDHQGNFINEKTAEFNIQERPVMQLMLSVDTNAGSNYSADLSWNDISNSYEQYGYRVLRSSDNGQTWETRSTWNGKETVKVLNVYPERTAEPYLKNWMNKIDPDTGEPAGKGLFDIETVYIDDYNDNPDTYLKDSNGSYKYDVILFGTADGNGYKDISSIARESTQNFIDSGRGVLFGHDSVSINNESYHPNFASFSEQLGITLKNNCNFIRTNNVEVVKQGFLTSYPWSISGKLNVPATHTYGQFSGGTLRGTVWMKLSNAATMTDSATGATNDAYLVTHNQLALIMTGDSPGQATIDECKVLANTLFYLKQLTSTTSTRDNSFLDEAAPSVPKVEYSLTEYSKNNYSIKADFSSKDLGTSYKYKVEGIPKSDNSDIVESNNVITEAFSDLKGFIVFTTDSADTAINMIEYSEDGITPLNIIDATDGRASYEMDNLDKNKEYYLHIFAVDNENNLSEEYVKMICESEEVISQAQINNSLSSDKVQYEAGQTSVLTAKANTTGTSLNATAEINLCTVDGKFVKNIAEDINIKLTSMATWSAEYNMSTEDLSVGKYMAEINWYVGGVFVSQSKCLIRVTENDYSAALTLKSNGTDNENCSNQLTWNNLNDDDEAGDIPTDFSVVVDCSGSMGGERIKNAKLAINNFIEQMNDGDRMNLIKFTSSASSICDFSNDKNLLKSCVNRISAGGGTRVSSGINHAISGFCSNDRSDENYNKAIILICDGDVDNCSDEINNAVANNIAIYTINVVNADSSYLQSMASQTGGKYYYTNIVTDMSEILQYIKLINDSGDYYYELLRDGEIIEALTKSEYCDEEFHDSSAPVIQSTQLTVSDINEISFSGHISIKAVDIGTDYEYVVNAVSKGNEDNIITSNKVVSTALSGIKGYSYEINTSSIAEPETAYDESCFVAAGDEFDINVNDLKRGKVYYLHIYAIDNQGNVSRETIYNFSVGLQFFETTNVTTAITTDKQNYSTGENICIDVTAKADFYKIFTKGIVQISDKNGNVVETVEPNYIAEITSYETLDKSFTWNVKNLVSDDYYATVKWYNGDRLIASDKTKFKVESDGIFKNALSTDKIEYLTTENIQITDVILNNTTNTYSDKLVVNIDFIDENGNISETISENISTVAGSKYIFSDNIKASLLGKGSYTAVSSINVGAKVVSESTTKFIISEPSAPELVFRGSVTANNYNDKEKILTYSVTNNGNTDADNVTVRVKVYSAEGKIISVIDKKTAISANQTVTYNEKYNTEALLIGEYPVTLSIITEDSETPLSTSGFIVNVINKYDVTFVDHDGTVLDSQKVEYGKGAAAPNNPEREADAQYTYEFSGWDSDFTNVVSDMSVQALYLVTKIDEPSVLETPATPENANSETTEVGTSEYSPSGDNSVHTGNRINSVYILCLILISFAVLLFVRRKMRLENLKGENERENIE